MKATLTTSITLFASLLVAPLSAGTFIDKPGKYKIEKSPWTIEHELGKGISFTRSAQFGSSGCTPDWIPQKGRRLILAGLMLALAGVSAGISTLAGQTSSQTSGLQVFYWHGLPALPFLALFILALFPSVSQPYMVMGAAFGAAASIAIPYFLLWISLANSRGGGANIGIGLLFLAMPVYLPFFMLGGSTIARFFHEVNSGPGKTKAQGASGPK